MDAQGFDHLATSLATGMSRRRIAKGLLAGGAAGTLALLGARHSTAEGCGAFCQAQCAGSPEPRACRAICLCSCGARGRCVR